MCPPHPEMCPHHGTCHLRLGTCSPVVPTVLECPPVPQEPKTCGVPPHLSMLGHAGALWTCWGMLGVMDVLVYLYTHAGTYIHACWHIHTCMLAHTYMHAGVSIYVCWCIHMCWCGHTCVLACLY